MQLFVVQPVLDIVVIADAPHENEDGDRLHQTVLLVGIVGQVGTVMGMV